MSSFLCPSDGTVLVPIERQGIEIDHCPQCRGVWLDRGELDKLIERGTVPAREPYREQPAQYDQRGGHGYPHKRRKSFLEELFD